MPVKWGILGASGFARQHMAPAIHAARRDVVVVASSSSPAPKPLGTTVAETRYERRSRRGDATRTTRRREEATTRVPAKEL